MIKILNTIQNGTLINFLHNITFGKVMAVFLSFTLSFIESLGAGIVGLLFLTIIDMYFGIRVSMINKNLKCALFKYDFWKSISSTGIRKTAIKFFLEFIPIISSAYVFETLILKNSFIGDMGFSLSMAAVLLLSFVELWSIGENYSDIRGMNPFKALISYFVKRESISDIIDDTIKEINENEPK